MSGQRTVFTFGFLLTKGRQYPRQRVSAWITDAAGKQTRGYLFIRGQWMIRVNWRELEKVR